MYYKIIKRKGGDTDEEAQRSTCDNRRHCDYRRPRDYNLLADEGIV